jgi:hypothetical protein
MDVTNRTHFPSINAIITSLPFSAVLGFVMTFIVETVVLRSTSELCCCTAIGTPLAFLS